ncbi:ABC transporter ATP-binding protein [Nocardioides sp. LMS-CY]|uniref:ABC transporter ATP-binding protein n=1 Tax=Nocardioides sp. (strain LMS-CY) TaxID=2840457 RepID=UPI001BFFDD03|nr:ABC transporter ATP-binding protein [Nocardioides sp. LMS-CY]QWF20523.1 ABC transporter ATP-binding protein [Nocardioides sp. LMS-CY]
MTESQADAAAIELVGIHKSFGTAEAVRGIDLAVRQGEFFSLLGPSGCGKTTTLRMMAGFEQPTSGSIRMHGRDVTALGASARPTNLVFQKYELFPHMTVFDNVAFGLRVKKVPKHETATRVAEMLDVTGVGDLAERRAEQLSGGQQQRVALARALVNKPQVLLLDEPLSALDAKLRHRMQVELKDIQARLGTTFLYVTHDQEEALMMSDRIGIMNAGRLEQVGTPDEVYERPATPFVADFVGATNTFSLVGSATQGGAVVYQSAGARIVLPPGTPAGEPVQAILRPERARIAAVGEQCLESSVRGTLTRVIYAGASSRLVVETELGPVIVSEAGVDRSGLPAEGSAVEVGWRADALRVVDRVGPGVGA